MVNRKARVFFVPLLAGALLLLLGWCGHSALAAAAANLAANPDSFSCASSTDIPAAECGALVALYNQAGGPNWTNHTNWLSESVGTACNNNDTGWYGVMCDDLGQHVQWLLLNSNQLSGTIPSELGNLPYTQWLLLDNNQLSGAIPSSLGSLSSLELLQLSFNQLTGTIPSQLGALVKLQTLNLENNSLTGSIPPQLGQAVSITQLLLKQNQLSGAIPPELGQITDLQQLDLSSNQLSGAIPAQLGNLASLKYLYLFDNQLTGAIPSTLGSLTNLESLALDQNQLSGVVPAQLSGLASLLGLQINSNPLVGALPQHLADLSQVSAFLFDTTRLCDPPDTVFQTWLSGIAAKPFGLLQRTNVRCITLTIGRSSSDAVLSWTHQPPNAGYEVYRSLQPYVLGSLLPPPLLAPTSVYTDTGAIGNPSLNYFYTIRAWFQDPVNNYSDTDQAGVFSFSLTPGN